MQSISLCMIVKNEEQCIDNCLKSIYKLMDEIIIVDTGSNDNTKEICRKYTEKIYDYKWDYDFGKARTYSFSLATSDYILWLDADDIIISENYIKLQKLKSSMSGDIDIYNLWYDYRHDTEGKCVYTFYRERIIKNTEDVYWDCVVHELLHFNKNSTIINTDIRVTHTNNHDNTEKYINFFEIKINSGYELNPREKYFYSTELIKNKKLKKAIPYIQDFINDTTYNYGYNNSYEISCAYGWLGDYYLEICDYRLSIKNYQLQIAYHHPSAKTYYNIAKCYSNLGNYDTAIFYLKSIIQIDFPKEKFINESKFHKLDYFYKLNNYRIKSLLTLVFIFYHFLKDINMAKLYNDKLLILDPQNESAIYNKNFFDNLNIN